MAEKTENIVRPEEIRSAVRQRYGQIAQEFNPDQGAACCGPSDCCGDTSSAMVSVQSLYETPDVAELPLDVTGISLGCGDPVTSGVSYND